MSSRNQQKIHIYLQFFLHDFLFFLLLCHYCMYLFNFFHFWVWSFYCLNPAKDFIKAEAVPHHFAPLCTILETTLRLCVMEFQMERKLRFCVSLPCLRDTHLLTYRKPSSLWTSKVFYQISISAL